MGNLSLRVHNVFNEIRSQLWITVEDEEIYFGTEAEINQTDDLMNEEEILEEVDY